MKFKSLYLSFAAVFLLFSKSGMSMGVDVTYSDWYWTDEKYYTIDIAVNKFVLEPGDPAVKNGVVNCSGYGCRFQVTGSYPVGSTSQYSQYVTPPGSSPVKVPLDELNEKINNITPWNATLVFKHGTPTGLCIRLAFQNTLPGTNIGSTCDGTLPPIPPSPPVPVFLQY